jgi:hypothetical protein
MPKESLAAIGQLFSETEQFDAIDTLVAMCIAKRHFVCIRVDTNCQKVTGYRTRTNYYFAANLCLIGSRAGMLAVAGLAPAFVTYWLFCDDPLSGCVSFSTPHRRSHFQAIHKKPKFAAEYPRKIADIGQFFSKANPALVAI